MRKEIYKPMLLMITGAKILSKILGNQIQQHIKKVNYQEKGIPGIWCYFNMRKGTELKHQVIWLEEKSYLKLSVSTEKMFDKIQHSAIS